jgi:hypothetical protein
VKLISRLSLLLVVLLIALIPSVVFAADGNDVSDFILQVNRPITIDAGQRADTVVVISDDARIDGTVTEALVVIDGDAWVSGVVNGDVVVARGTLHLLAGSQTGDISLWRGEVVREDGAVVTGSIDRIEGFSYWDAALFSIVFWIGMTMVLVVAGLIFAAVGGRQLERASGLLGQKPAGSIGWAAILFIGLPILAVSLLLTIVGIPLGLGVLIFLLPTLWFLGYLVAATAIGNWLARRFGWSQRPERPYLSAVLGVLTFGIIGLIPWIGGLIATVAATVGAGALGYAAWRGWREPAVAEEAQPRAVVSSAA